MKTNSNNRLFELSGPGASGYVANCTDQNFELLSKMERKILSLIACGFTSKNICSLLQVKQREVEMHRYNIKLKLKVRSYRALVRFINESRLINYCSQDSVQ